MKSGFVLIALAVGVGVLLAEIVFRPMANAVTKAIKTAPTT